MKKFRKKLKELGLDTYKQYLKSGYWQTVKLKFKNSHFKKACCICDDRNYELHHTNYNFIGHENIACDVIPLCRLHHEKLHRYIKITDIPITIFTLRDVLLNISQLDITTLINKLGKYYPFIFTTDELKSVGLEYLEPTVKKIIQQQVQLSKQLSAQRRKKKRLEDKKWRESQGKTRAKRRKNKNILLESSKEYRGNRSKCWLNYKKETFKKPTVYY